jgi:hypothetical protein
MVIEPAESAEKTGLVNTTNAKPMSKRLSLFMTPSIKYYDD